MNEENIRFDDVINAIKKGWRIIVVTTLAFTIAAIVINFFFIEPQYKAYTKLFVGKDRNEDKSENYNSSEVQMYQKLSKTYIDIIQTNDTVENACKAKGIEVNPQDILSRLTVSSESDTQILTIEYLDKDRERARDIVEAISEEFQNTSTQFFNAYVKVVETVKLPQAPATPNKKVNIAISFLLGIIFGTAIVLIIQLFDRTFKDKEEVERVVGIPVIGTIPEEEEV